MKTANIGQLKDNLSHYVSMVEHGEEVEICRRNRSVARIVPIKDIHMNKTKLGCGKGTVTFTDADLTEAFVPENDWEMHS